MHLRFTTPIGSQVHTPQGETSSSRLILHLHQTQNKTNSAVQLTHIPTGIVVKSQATRSQSQNRKIAREILAAKLDELRNGDQSRTAIVADVKRKKAANAAKKARRKHRKAAAEAHAAAGVTPEDSHEPPV